MNDATYRAGGSRLLLRLLSGVLVLTAGVGSAWARGGEAAPWTAATLDAFATLPVQDRGRVKPMDSLAGLKLLTFNGKRSLKLANGEKLTHTAWLFGCLFDPDQAKTQPCFRVQNDGVLTDIGLEPKGKRAWYSYQELVPGQRELMSKAGQHAGVDAKRQTPLQRQVLKLAGDVREFEGLLSSFSALRHPYEIGGSARLAEMLGGGDTVLLSSILRHAHELLALREELAAEPGAEALTVGNLLSSVGRAVDEGSRGVTLFPPAPGVEDQAAWWNVSDLIMAAFESGHDVDLGPQLDLLESIERAVAAGADPESVEADLASFNAGVRALAEARGEYGHIPLEVKLNRWKPFLNALVLYILGFVLIAGSWLFTRARWLRWGVWGATSAATVLVVLGITMRCIIRERPPVVSLYDTIIFITGCIVIVCLALEWLTRLRIALALGTILGIAGMFLASRYEMKEVASSGDTMASVVAVLDTNYYLAIHVTTIALGYAGGLLAGAIAHVWILGKLFGLRKNDAAFYRTISRMTYGVLCFSLLFSIFGTIMGGIWANDSWGRFWGWDPKENGALLICIWQLLILHARMGGYVRDRGLAVLSVFGAVVVAASWWGVNLLGVGLHSYGFTSGVFLSLVLFAGVEFLVMLVAGIQALVESSGSAPPPAPPDPLVEGPST